MHQLAQVILWVDIFGLRLFAEYLYECLYARINTLPPQSPIVNTTLWLVLK